MAARAQKGYAAALLKGQCRVGVFKQYRAFGFVSAADVDRILDERAEAESRQDKTGLT